MEPIFNDRQMLIAKKFNLNINRNDIVVIKVNKKTIIKRIIGIPGDKIRISQGYVFVNDEKFDDRYTSNPGNIKEEITLLENEFFVLGDNRNYSIDSRFDEIGIILRKNIIAKIVL